MHPVENIRGLRSGHLAKRRIVLGVCGSIAAVQCVELARELIRHGADVIPVMTESATRIVHPDALEFATGHKPLTRLGGQVEHVSLLGDVAGRADLFLIAPATANTVAKMALGIDDTPVTTCATVAFGTKVPVVVAPAMHEAMLRHAIVSEHAKTLVDRLGVTWVEPVLEEKKAKLADVDTIVEAVIHRLAKESGPLAGQKALVISGATVEPVDPVRILTNRSSGRSGILIATELSRLGAEVTLWQGHGTVAVPSFLQPCAIAYSTHGDLSDLVKAEDLAGYAQVWMPAAIGDYAATPAAAKIPSGKARFTLELTSTAKVIPQVRAKAPDAVLVAFKAESDAKRLLKQAKGRLKEYGADFVVANTSDAFGASDTTAHLVDRKDATRFTGRKETVLAAIVLQVAKAAAAAKAGKARKPKPSRGTGKPSTTRWRKGKRR